MRRGCLCSRLIDCPSARRYQALYWIAQTQPGERVLIHAGASGVGLAAIQLAKAFGALVASRTLPAIPPAPAPADRIHLCRRFRSKTVITTAGSQDKLEFCKSLGADVGINYKAEADFSKKVLDATDGAGVDVVIDFGPSATPLRRRGERLCELTFWRLAAAVGANYWVPNLTSLAKDGRLVLLGLLSGGDVPQVSRAAHPSIAPPSSPSSSLAR